MKAMAFGVTVIVLYSLGFMWAVITLGSNGHPWLALIIAICGAIIAPSVVEAVS